jgi:hypothetical protein
MAAVAAVAAGLSGVVPAAAADPPEPVVQARWVFDGDADDVTGNGHDGAVGAGVVFEDGAAVFSNSDSSEITIPHDPDLEPAAGKSWTLELEGITPGALTGNHQTIVQSRDSDSRYWIFYIIPSGAMELWTRQATGLVKFPAGVTAQVGSTYNVTITVDEGSLTIETTGAATADQRYSTSTFDLNAGGQPLRFGNGGNTGTQYFFRGSLGGASITTMPPTPGLANVALGKGAAAFSAADDGAVFTEKAAGSVTDGALGSYFGHHGPSYTQVDLGAVHDVERVAWWRYFSDGRKDQNTVVVTAETLEGFKTGKGRVVLWNATTEADLYHPSLGSLPAGDDPVYAESSGGQSATAPDGARARYVRLYGTGNDYTAQGAQNINHVVEIQVWGAGEVVRPSWQEGADVIVPASVEGKSQAGFEPAKAMDGDPDTYWLSPASNSDYDYWRHFDVNLDGLYDLSQVRIVNSNRGIANSRTGNDPYGGADYSHYQIYASRDGESFSKIAHKSDDAAATFDPDVYDVSGDPNAKGVSAVRVSVVYDNAEQSVRVYEVELRGAKAPGDVPVAPGVSVEDFEETDWAEEWELVESDPDYAEAKLVDEMGNLVGRVLGAGWRDSFEFVVEDVQGWGASQDKDAFSVQGSGGVITIKGRNGASLGSGLNHYLKNYAMVNYNPIFGSNVDMPDVLPMPDGVVVKTTNYDIRNILNFCTWGYTMAGWGWGQIEAFLDWSALNGINLMVDVVGQEEVIRRLFLEYGYTEAEIRDYIVGPAYFPWYYMQNLFGVGGPLPDNWFGQRVETARKMHDRMQTFGIAPIIQGYSGMVPTDFTSKNPDAQVIAQGGWGGETRPSMLRTIVSGGVDYFAQMAPAFYEIQGDVFGDTVSHYYAVDPFHEGGITGGMDMTAVYDRVQDLMVEWDPKAIWVIQQWWGQVTVAKLNGLDKDHVLVLSLASEQTPSGEVAMEQTGTPWIWNILHAFGGRQGMNGPIYQVAETMPNRYQSANSMVGIGTVAEGLSNTAAIYDLLFDMGWESSPADVQEYITRWADSHYGAANDDEEQAWQIMAETVLSSTTMYNRKANNIMHRPGFQQATYGFGEEFEAAVPKLVAAYRAAGAANPALDRDLAEVAIEMISFETNRLLGLMQKAYNAKDRDAWSMYSGEFLDAVAALDQIADTVPSLRAGNWIEDARSMLPEMDDWTRDLFEFNARALITTWGTARSVHDVYASRLWSGVAGDLYLERWKVWVDQVTRALRDGSTTVQSVDWFLTDWKWANYKSDEGHGYGSQPSGSDLAGLVQAACHEFCAYAGVVDKSDLQVAAGSAGLKDDEDYTPDTWAAFAAALAAANAVLDDTAATQGRVDGALTVLDAAAGALEPTGASGPAVTPSVAFKCAAGKVYLAVTVVNNELEEPVSLMLSGPFGSKSFASVSPGRKATASFNTLTAGLSQGGALALTAGVAGGEPVVSGVAYGTYACGG